MSLGLACGGSASSPQESSAQWAPHFGLIMDKKTLKALNTPCKVARTSLFEVSPGLVHDQGFGYGYRNFGQGLARPAHAARPALTVSTLLEKGRCNFPVTLTNQYVLEIEPMDIAEYKYKNTRCGMLPKLPARMSSVVSSTCGTSVLIHNMISETYRGSCERTYKFSPRN